MHAQVKRAGATVYAVVDFEGIAERLANAKLYMVAAALEMHAEEIGARYTGPNVSRCESWGGQWGKPLEARGTVSIETHHGTDSELEQAEDALRAALNKCGVLA